MLLQNILAFRPSLIVPAPRIAIARSRTSPRPARMPGGNLGDSTACFCVATAAGRVRGAPLDSTLPAPADCCSSKRRLEKHEALRREALLPQGGRDWVPMREEITIFS